MGMSSGGDDRGMMAEINVTPFVDVMLVLLIIFMVTAPMMTTGIDVELPRADAPSLSQKNDSQVFLAITADGRYLINQSEFPFEEMQGKLAAIAQANPDQDVFLQADAQVPYEKVAQLMAAVTAAGMPRVGLVTQPGIKH
jgi:biopolymer transport protein TolR